MKTLNVTNSIHRSPLRRGFVLTALALALAGLALSPQARAGAYRCEQGCDFLTRNTFLGEAALSRNTTGSANTANGFFALFSNTTGNNNTANGVNALFSNTTGNRNTANGVNALFSNTTGINNMAEGLQALYHNTGSNNIGLGSGAGSNLTIGSNNIDIGSGGAAGESNTIRIGSAQVRTFIKGISGAVVSGAPVVVNAGGQLGMTASSERFKDEIKPMDKASEGILALKPVTFRYKKDIDPDSIPQFGLVAEQVAKVNPNLVTRDAKGDIYTVRYEQVNAMLLNEFLKEHRRVEEQQATVAGLQSIAAKQEAINAELKGTIAQQEKSFQSKLAEEEKQIAALTSGLQKVSAQIETGKAAPQMALNNP